MFSSAQLEEGQRLLDLDRDLLSTYREKIQSYMQLLAWAVPYEAALADGAALQACMEHDAMMLLFNAHNQSGTGDTVESARAFANRGRNGHAGAFQVAELIFQAAAKAAPDRAQRGRIRHDHEVLLEEMAAAGLALAGSQRAMYLIGRGNKQGVIPHVEHSACRGNPQAMHRLSFLLAETSTPPVEPGVSGLSLPWCERACALGHPHALNVRANALADSGEGEEASRLRAQAASRGSLEALVQQVKLEISTDLLSADSKKKLWRVIAAGYDSEVNTSYPLACVMLASSYAIGLPCSYASYHPIKGLMLLHRAAACCDGDDELASLVRQLMEQPGLIEDSKRCSHCSRVVATLSVRRAFNSCCARVSH